MKTHTPGPWHWSGADLIGGDGTTIDESQLDPNDIHKDGEMEANATLISAAPELLAACKGVLAVYAPFQGDAVWLTHKRILEAAIAKAEGRS